MRLYHEAREIAHTNMDNTPAAYDSLFKRCDATLERWADALKRFEQSRGQPITYKERMGLKILRIHQQYRQFVLLDISKMGPTDSGSWDRYNSTFEDIVSQASSVLGMMGSPSLSSDATEDSRLTPSFSLDMGIIAILYDIATLCRDPSTRRKAVRALRSASRQEGLLNSHVCAVVAEKIILLEETIALRGLGDSKSFVSVLPLILESEKQHQQQNRSIQRSFEVPDTARLPFAYPSFDTVNNKAFLTIGEGRETLVRIPLSGMIAMLDLER